MASLRTTAGPTAGAELFSSAEQSQASVQEELGLTEDWANLMEEQSPAPVDPTRGPRPRSRGPERNLSDERAQDERDGRQASVGTRAGPHCGTELVLSGEQSQASEKQVMPQGGTRAELQ